MDIESLKIAYPHLDFLANTNISEVIEDMSVEERRDWEFDILLAVQDLLDALLIDTKNDHNTRETACRVKKMFVNEIFSGRYKKCPDLKAFPNDKNYDQVYLTGPLEIRSTCAHHFQPIIGNAWVGIMPGKNVLGLSKFNRIVDWIASRPQIQEDMTEQIGDMIAKACGTDNIAVVIKATHLCVTQRGVRAACSDMTTSVIRGRFRSEPHLKQEFFQLVAGMKGYNE